MKPAKMYLSSRFNNCVQSDESDDESSRVKRKRIRHRLSSLSSSKIRSYSTVDPTLQSSAIKIQNFTLEDALCYPGARQIQHGFCTNLVSIWNASHYASISYEKSSKDFINNITETVEQGEQFGNMAHNPFKTLQITSIWKQLNEIHTKRICSHGLEPERNSTLVISESLIIQKMLFTILSKGDYIIVISNPTNLQKFIIHLTNRDFKKINKRIKKITGTLQHGWTLKLSSVGTDQNEVGNIISLTKAC